MTTDITAGTVRLHRVIKSTPERVYRAFTDPAAMVKWIPPFGFVGKIESMDVQVGGSYRMSFTNFSSGNSHHFGGTYTDVVPGKLLSYVDKFDDPNLAGEMKVTIHFNEVICGTELIIEQSGIPSAIPTPFCYLGWQESLALLALLVEPNIPDNA